MSEFETPQPRIQLPADPLQAGHQLVEREYYRRMVAGVLESYNSNYDFLAELLQNAVDAVEDAYIEKLPDPFLVRIELDLVRNRISVLDTGIGMSQDQAIAAFAPNISYKNPSRRAGKGASYRGYKGVGLTFLAYGTNEIVLHSREAGSTSVFKGKMSGALDWVQERTQAPPKVEEDTSPSPLDAHERGTYVEIQLSRHTRPRELRRMASSLRAWATILRTRTAVGQILVNQEAFCSFLIQLSLVTGDNEEGVCEVTPRFVFPHEVEREPEFRFLDVEEFWAKHGPRTEIPAESRRQDGIYLTWNPEQITEHLREKAATEFRPLIDQYQPSVYAFLPYHSPVWAEINNILTGDRRRRELSAGLVIGVNRQRLADMFELKVSRFEALSKNMLVVVHFEGARPDQGRKTLQDDVLALAQSIGDATVQYLANQRKFLKAPGEASSPGQREVEREHQDWLLNVRMHATTRPLHLPQVNYRSEPLTEQDVIGLFHELAALGIFPGLEVFATSQSRTYDSLVRYSCATNCPGVRFISRAKNPLGVSPYVLGDTAKFETKHLTLEFKNNLDGLIGDFGGDSKKEFGHIDICVAWGLIDEQIPGFLVEPITTNNVDERKYPGCTHLLRREGDSHVIQVTLLQEVAKLLLDTSVNLLFSDGH
jgi:hypothetical protein